MSATVGRDDPFIHLRHSAAGVVCSGETAYRQGYLETPGGAPGVFARWQWDGTTLTASGDRLGLSPLFVFSSPSEIALSPSLVRLQSICGTTALDSSALALFVRMGFYVGDDTPLAQIRMLPPGGRLEWTGGQPTVRGGYTWGKPLSISRSDALDQAAVLFRRAVAARLPTAGRVVLPLSGGRDSRHILFELEECGALPEHCVTVPRYPPHAAEDERVAPLLARAAGVRHVLLPQRGQYWSERRKNRDTSLCADEHAWFIPLVDHLSSHADVVYDGLGGSLYVGARFTTSASHAAWRAGRHGEVARDLLDRFAIATEPALEAVLSPRGRRDLSRAAALARLETEVAQHAHAPDPHKSFHFWSRLRRELALVPFGLLRSKTVFAPLVDHDLYDFMTGLPPEVVAPAFSRRDKTFHDDLLRLMYPRHAALPFEDRAAPEVDASAHRIRFAARTAAHLAVTRTPLLARRAAVARLLRCVGDRRYRASMSWLPGLALYLADLDALASGDAA